MITAIILNVPIPLFASNTLGITWTICWWLANYSPGGVVAKILKLAPVRIPAKVCCVARPRFAMLGPAVQTPDARPLMAMRDC